MLRWDEKNDTFFVLKIDYGNIFEPPHSGGSYVCTHFMFVSQNKTKNNNVPLNPQFYIKVWSKGYLYTDM